MEVEKERGNRLEVSFGAYFGHTKRNLKLFRLWETENDVSVWKTSLIIGNTTIFLTCNLLLGLCELTRLKNAPDLPTVASGIGSFWFHLLGFSKWFYFVCKVRNVMELVQELEECYYLSLGMNVSDEDSSRLHKEMRMARKSSVNFAYVWTIFTSYGVVHWCANPLILQWSYSRLNTNLTDSERLLPYEAWIPWDTNESSGYCFAYLFQFVGGFASAIGHISYDVFYVTLVMMICAQFRYLNYSLTADKAESKKLTYRFLNEKLQRSQIYHNAILKVLASLEKLTSPVMFVETVGIIGILCLVSFEAMTMKLKGDIKNTIRVWSMLEYIFGCFTQLFAFCYYADKITALGLQVADSAYNCGWESSMKEKEGSIDNHELQKKERRAVAFLTREIIFRAQKSVQLTAGPFYILSLDTYRAVLGAAFSYSAVLRGLGEE